MDPRDVVSIIIDYCYSTKKVQFNFQTLNERQSRGWAMIICETNLTDLYFNKYKICLNISNSDCHNKVFLNGGFSFAFGVIGIPKTKSIKQFKEILQSKMFDETIDNENKNDNVNKNKNFQNKKRNQHFQNQGKVVISSDNMKTHKNKKQNIVRFLGFHNINKVFNIGNENGNYCNDFLCKYIRFGKYTNRDRYYCSIGNENKFNKIVLYDSHGKNLTN